MEIMKEHDMLCCGPSVVIFFNFNVLKGVSVDSVMAEVLF